MICKKKLESKMLIRSRLISRSFSSRMTSIMDGMEGKLFNLSITVVLKL